MQVSVTPTQGLERRMTVEVPAERIENEVQSRLRSMVRTVRIAGFRPGKAPLKVIERKYGAQVREDVVNAVVQSSFSEAVTRESLRPAGMPQFDEMKVEPGQPLAYTARFEIYPEIERISLDNITVKRPVATITEQDVDEMLEKMRRQRATWEGVDRPAADGDRLTIDFTGTIAGEPFAGNQAEDFEVVLGSGALFEGFEEKLAGTRAGDELTLDLRFPDDYHVVALAGQPVQFAVSIKKVEEPRLPEVNADFARAYGIADGSIDAMREEMKRSMEHELQDAIRTGLRAQIMDALVAANPVEVPRALVDQEVNDLLGRFFERMGIDRSRAEKLNIPRDAVEEKATRNVALRLILAETIRRHEIKVSPEALRATVESVATSYDNPEEVVKWYYADRQRLAEMESLTLEQQLVDWALEHVTVEEEQTSFPELMARRQALMGGAA